MIKGVSNFTKLLKKFTPIGKERNFFTTSPKHAASDFKFRFLEQPGTETQKCIINSCNDNLQHLSDFRQKLLHFGCDDLQFGNVKEAEELDIDPSGHLQLDTLKIVNEKPALVFSMKKYLSPEEIIALANCVDTTEYLDSQRKSKP